MSYISLESQANAALHGVASGAVGFDTEFTDRRATPPEKQIIDALAIGANKKTAILGWQIVELNAHSTFPIAWKNIGLRLIQIAHGNHVWVLDMWKIKGEQTNNMRSELTLSQPSQLNSAGFCHRQTLPR